jgi:hypothetical protein
MLFDSQRQYILGHLVIRVALETEAQHIANWKEFHQP